MKVKFRMKIKILNKNLFNRKILFMKSEIKTKYLHNNNSSHYHNKTKNKHCKKLKKYKFRKLFNRQNKSQIIITRNEIINNENIEDLAEKSAEIVGKAVQNALKIFETIIHSVAKCFWDVVFFVFSF